MIFIGNGKFIHSDRIDRVLLKDMIDGRATLDPAAVQGACPPKRPTPRIEYKMPKSADPWAQ